MQLHVKSEPDNEEKETTLFLTVQLLVCFNSVDQPEVNAYNTSVLREFDHLQQRKVDYLLSRLTLIHSSNKYTYHL